DSAYPPSAQNSNAHATSIQPCAQPDALCTPGCRGISGPALDSLEEIRVMIEDLDSPVRLRAIDLVDSEIGQVAYRAVAATCLGLIQGSVGHAEYEVHAEQFRALAVERIDRPADRGGRIDQYTALQLDGGLPQLGDDFGGEFRTLVAMPVQTEVDEFLAAETED